MVKSPNKGHGVGPLFTRLVSAGRLDDVKFLAEHVKAMRMAANDNYPASDDEASVDSVVETRPTPNEIILAGRDGLRFDKRGRLVAWRATDKDGRPVLNRHGKEMWLKAIERYKQPRGGKPNMVDAKAEIAKHSEWLMSLYGVGKMPPPWIPDVRYPSIGVAFDRIKAASDEIARAGLKSDSRQFLADLGADGRLTLAQSAESNPQATVMRGTTVIAHGAEFISGRVNKSGTATEGSFVGAPDAVEAALVTSMDAVRVSQSARGVHDVLAMALAGMTAVEVAMASGKKGNKSGERWAIRTIDAAIERLKKKAA